MTIDAASPGPVLLGQSSACALRLTDREVSRRHVAFDVDGPRLRITDQASRNGTFVDGVAVLDGFVSGGELVRVGSSALRVDRSAPAGRSTPPRRNGFGRFIGESKVMQRLYPLIERLAVSDVPLVIEGETGTGKEVLAESIHEQSGRRDGPYVVLDCTTIAPSLAESELFGHRRGAFTGATENRRGVFEQAHGGTLLLDEIGDLELGLQAKLLRAIDRGELRRVGEADRIQFDVRVIAATRRDLDSAVQAGTFRDDLFHRLAVGRIALPPLRRRQGDIALFAKYFWSAIVPGTALPARLLERWESDPWRGNVRELKNAVARYLATTDLACVADDDAVNDGPRAPAVEGGDVDAVYATVEQSIRSTWRSEVPYPVARQRILEAAQKGYVERALVQHGGNAEQASAALGVSRRYFHILRTGKRTR